MGTPTFFSLLGTDVHTCAARKHTAFCWHPWSLLPTKSTCLLDDPMLASRPQWPGSRATLCSIACPVATVPGWRSRLSGFAQKHNHKFCLYGENEWDMPQDVVDGTINRWQNLICNCSKLQITCRLMSTELHTNAFFVHYGNACIIFNHIFFFSFWVLGILYGWSRNTDLGFQCKTD